MRKDFDNYKKEGGWCEGEIFLMGYWLTGSVYFAGPPDPSGFPEPDPLPLGMVAVGDC